MASLSERLCFVVTEPQSAGGHADNAMCGRPGSCPINSRLPYAGAHESHQILLPDSVWARKIQERKGKRSDDSPRKHDFAHAREAQRGGEQ